jgi:hypothetical protein
MTAWVQWTHHVIPVLSDRVLDLIIIISYHIAQKFGGLADRPANHQIKIRQY